MFNRKKKKTCCETPTRSRFSMAPNPNLGWQPTESSGTKPPKPPTSGSNAVKPNPNYTPPASVKKSCPYELPCGWCTKWDKKCDKKVGCDNDKPQRGLREDGNVYDDYCQVSNGIIRKIIQEFMDYEQAMNQLKEITKENIK